jgi:cytochrome c heme-lyase
VYNVYNQRIDGQQQQPAQPDMLDSTNNMPREPNQRPWAGQQAPLSTQRVVSSIPKGGTADSWLYPSPQMFFNALMRKGKGEDVTEQDMASVVHAHNSMNEKTWERVAEWEQLHCAACPDPRLLRFRGRPDDLSPLARMSSWVGGQLPFDRHDWWVDRCGREVRYVIDFYYNEDLGGTPNAFELRVRPALDSPTAAVDRLKMNIYTACAKWGVPCPITGSPSRFSDAAAAAAASAQQEQQQ